MAFQISVLLEDIIGEAQIAMNFKLTSIQVEKQETHNSTMIVMGSLELMRRRKVWKKNIVLILID
jgi:hypothetical protein